MTRISAVAGVGSREASRVRTGGAGTPPPGARWNAFSEVRLRAALAIFFLSLVAAGWLLHPVAPGAPMRLTLAGQALPGVCAIERTTGIPCPGCGLTRSWVSALHGDLAASRAHHPVGWLVLLYVLAQGIRHGAWVLVARRRAAIERFGFWLDRGVIAVGALLFLVWLPVLVRELGERLG